MPSLLDCHVSEKSWLKEAGEGNGASPAPARLHGANEAPRAVPDAGPWEPAIVNIVKFQHLGDNWDGQGAQAPSHELLVSAIGLAYTLNEQGVDPPSRVVPAPDGSVIFEWQWPNGAYGEIAIDRPLHAEVMLIERGQAAKHWTIPTE